MTHGTPSAYTKGCRCAACREAWRGYQLAYMATNPEQREKHRLREAGRRKVAVTKSGAT